MRVNAQISCWEKIGLYVPVTDEVLNDTRQGCP